MGNSNEEIYEHCRVLNRWVCKFETRGKAIEISDLSFDFEQYFKDWGTQWRISYNTNLDKSDRLFINDSYTKYCNDGWFAKTLYLSCFTSILHHTTTKLNDILRNQSITISYLQTKQVYELGYCNVWLSYSVIKCISRNASQSSRSMATHNNSSWMSLSCWSNNTSNDSSRRFWRHNYSRRYKISFFSVNFLINGWSREIFLVISCIYNTIILGICGWLIVVFIIRTRGLLILMIDHGLVNIRRFIFTRWSSFQRDLVWLNLFWNWSLESSLPFSSDYIIIFLSFRGGSRVLSWIISQNIWRRRVLVFREWGWQLIWLLGSTWYVWIVGIECVFRWRAKRRVRSSVICNSFLWVGIIERIVAIRILICCIIWCIVISCAKLLGFSLGGALGMWCIDCIRLRSCLYSIRRIVLCFCIILGSAVLSPRRIRSFIGWFVVIRVCCLLASIIIIFFLWIIVCSCF